jgi:hypothetical protein
MKIQLPSIHTPQLARSILGGIRRFYAVQKKTFLLGLLPLVLLSTAKADYLVDFEGAGETKTSYASGTVNLNGVDWDLTEALIGTVASDIKNGARAARIRNSGSLTMLADKENGLGTISLQYARSDFSGDRTGTSPSFVVEYSTNQGGSWTQAGSTTSLAGVNSLTPFSAEVNVTGNVRIRIRQTAGDTGKRWNVDDILLTDFAGDPGEPGDSVPPALGEVAVSNLSWDAATLSAIFSANSGEDFTFYGFAIAATAVSDTPELGQPGVVDVAFNHIDDPITSPIAVTIDGLDPETSYSVRAYVIYDNGAESIYSPSATTFVTTVLPPALDGVTDYTETFASFVDMETVPVGWSFDLQGSNRDYIGDWGFVPEGPSSGFRGNDSVLGYQITTGSNSLIKILTLINDTGETITDLTIQYTGRVERASETRNAAYTVFVDGEEVPALAFTTESGSDASRSVIVSDLNIADGESFTIEWHTAQMAGGGSTRQIGISDVSVSVGINDLPPTIGFFALAEGTLTETEFGVDAEVTSDGGAAITQMGFIRTLTAEEPNPTLDTPGAVIDFDAFPEESFFFIDYTGLEPGTSYTVRAFATNSQGTTYTAPLVVTTLAPPPSVKASEAYTESFSNFTGSLPDGWSVSGPITAYNGDWSTGTGAGMRGGEETPGVLGFQHTGSTGTFTVTLELVNDTGDTITDLRIAYTGRVARVDQNRFPAWAVAVDGVPVPELAYSTAGGVDADVEFVLSGLSIPAGDTFTITWSSSNDGAGSGASRQMGLSNVSVEAVEISMPVPVLSLAVANYFADQTVFVSNFEDYAGTVNLYYTTDGSTPNDEGALYDDTTGILLEDGNGLITLRVIAIDSTTDAESFISSATYTFPINVTDLETLRGQATGSTIYRVTGEITFTGGDSFRNTKFFQDAGAGIQIDDNNGIIETVYSAGDIISGLVGTLGLFQEQLRFVPSFDPGEGTPGTVPEPLLRTLDTISENDQSMLVRVNDVTFDNTGTFGGGGNSQPITQGEASGWFRNVFGDSNITDSEIPSGPVDLIGIVQYNVVSSVIRRNIAPRSLADIILQDTPPGQGSPFDTFMEQFQGLQLSDRAPDADPARDGVPNAAKFVFGGSPLVADRSMLPASDSVDDNGNTFFVLRLNFARAATWDPQTATFTGDGFTVQVRSSDNLISFDPAAMEALSGINQSGEVEADSVVELRTTAPISGAQFFDTLINVEQPEQ